MYGRGETTYTNKDVVDRLVRQAACSAQRIEVEDLELKLKSAKARLDRLHSSCPHKWSESIDTSIVTEGYTSPGDEPGTMGIDWRGPCYVPGSTKAQWTRVCSLCGKAETTSQVTKHVSESPKW